MDSVARDVVDLSPDERHAFESVLGRPLGNHQRVVVGLVDTKSSATNSPIPTPPPDWKVTIKREGDVGILPDWCAIFADLSDEEMAELEAAILDRSDSRSFDAL